jgi:hypothetical protein
MIGQTISRDRIGEATAGQRPRHQVFHHDSKPRTAQDSQLRWFVKNESLGHTRELNFNEGL